MAASYVLNSQQSKTRAGVAAQGLCNLAQGNARSLRARRAMQLRVLCGRAWLTRGTGQQGWLDDAGDVLLHVGQGVQVAAGEQVVIEPLGGQPLQYQWCNA